MRKGSLKKSDEFLKFLQLTNQFKQFCVVYKHLYPTPEKKMSTRARDTHRMVDLLHRVDRVLWREVYFEIKWYVLCPGDGTYPANPDEAEAKRIQKLKLDCYKEVGRQFKKMGIFSSQLKKDRIFPGMLEAILDFDERNRRLVPEFGPDRIPRGVVEVSVLRAVYNGLRKMKLSDGQMPEFDDSEE
jgi:hypothetical protein